MLRTFRIAFACTACIAVLAGCVYYEPVPAYYPQQVPAPTPAQSFERAWTAALSALSDTGVRVTSSDMATGVIRGAKDQTQLLVNVSRQADGTLTVEVEATSPQGRDAGFAKSVTEAYKRRMGV